MVKSPNPLNLLLIEDDQVLQLLMRTALLRSGLAVSTTGTIAEAIKHMEFDPPQIVITDLGLPDGNGLEILNYARIMPSLPLVIVMTGNSSLETATAALRLGAFDYLSKPINIEFLLAAVGRAAENIRLRRTIDLMTRQQAHEEAIQATALAAAHHLSQHLTVIQGEVQLLQEYDRLPAEIAETLTRIGEAAQRATTTIHNLQQARVFVTEDHGSNNVMLDLLAASRP